MFSMRCISRAALLAVAALALSGVTAAAASAAQWLRSGSPVEKSTPVTHTGKFIITTWDEFKNKEVFTCKVSGKGTVNAKGAGTITAWNLTSCEESGEGVYKCETGTRSGPTALNLPWTTQLKEEGGRVVNDVGTAGELAVTWECKASLLGIKGLYKETCKRSEENTLEGEGSEAWEVWQRLIEWRCERSFGSKKLETTIASVSGGNLMKFENEAEGTLSFEK
jgi:hypothetical protein